MHSSHHEQSNEIEMTNYVMLFVGTEGVLEIQNINQHPNTKSCFLHPHKRLLKEQRNLPCKRS